jgi:hypothetical protein
MGSSIRLLLVVSLGSALLAASLVLLRAGSTGTPSALAAATCTAPGGSYLSIQEAIDDDNCTTVIVAIGHHTENLVINRTLTLQGQDKATTIIDGGGNGPVIRVTGGAPIIENLTIMGGDASNNLGCGGGVSIVGAAATVRDNSVWGNVASSDGDVMGWGGGVCAMTGTGTVYITGNTIQDNAAFSATTATLPTPGIGGGIGISRRHSTVVMTGNQVLNNVAVRMPATNAVMAGGGGIWSDADFVTIQGNRIEANVANGATGIGTGGGVGTNHSVVTLSDNHILNNLSVHSQTNTAWGAWTAGGGIVIYGAPTATVRGNWVMTNTAAVVAQSSASPQNLWVAGGGILVQDSDGLANDYLVLEDNHVIANVVVQTMTTSGADSQGHAEGGGLHASGISTTLALSNEVRGNVSVRYLSLGSGGGSDTWGGRPSGGGIYLANDDTVTVSDNHVLNNTTAWRQVVDEVDSSSEAGGIVLDNIGSATMVDNTIRGNTAVRTGSLTSDSGRQYHASGGGIAATCWERPTCSLTLEGNDISDNVGARTLSKSGSNAEIGAGGGGARLQGNIVVVLRSNVISGNTSAISSESAWGGGIEVIGNRVTMERNLILGNRQNSTGQGDAGGVNIGHSSVVTSSNDILARNYDAFTVHSQSRLTLINDTLYHNTNDGDGVGAAVRQQSTLVVSNSIIAGHQVGLQLDNGDPPVVLVEDYNLLNNTINYDGPIAQGAHDIWSQNPRFMNAAADDFHLQGSSPALDTANPAWAPSVDFYGSSRPQGAGPDIGAVERVGGLYLPVVKK